MDEEMAAPSMPNGFTKSKVLGIVKQSPVSEAYKLYFGWPVPEK